jgi:hypothetical protein
MMAMVEPVMEVVEPVERHVPIEAVEANVPIEAVEANVPIKGNVPI